MLPHLRGTEGTGSALVLHVPAVAGGQEGRRAETAACPQPPLGESYSPVLDKRIHFASLDQEFNNFNVS